MTDDWDENVPGPRSPLVPVLGACVLMVIGALAAPLFLGHEALLPLIGGGAAVGLVLWVLVLILAMRSASILWKLGSLALMLAIGAAAGLAVHVRDQGHVRRDVGTIAEMEIATNGIVKFQPGAAERGPLSKLLVEASRADDAEQDAFGAAAGKLGIGNLNSSYNLARDPAILGRCAEIASLKKLTDQARQNRQARHAEIVKVANTMSLPPEIVRAVSETMAPTDDPARLNALAKATNDGLDGAQAQCTALARRNWSDQMGYFGWSLGADADAYDAGGKLKAKSANDQGEIEREARDKALAAQEVIRGWVD